MDSDGNGLILLDQNPHDSAPDSEPIRRRFRRNRIASKVQAANLQRFVYDATLALKDAITSPVTGKLVMNEKAATAIHRLVGAWDTAADRYRIARGKGLPASERPKANRRAAQVEPLPG